MVFPSCNLFLFLLFSAIESELQQSNSKFLLKAAKLEGLEKEVKNIRDYIRSRVAFYATCTE